MIGGKQFSVWYGTNTVNNISKPVVSYVAQQNFNSWTFSLGDFIRDATTRTCSGSTKCLDPSWYLTTVFAGFEIWRGSVGVEVKDFGVTVPSIERGRTSTPVASSRRRRGVPALCGSPRAPSTPERDLMPRAATPRAAIRRRRTVPTSTALVLGRARDPIARELSIARHGFSFARKYMKRVERLPSPL